MSTLHLTPLDFAVVALFVAAILVLGFSAKLKDHTVFQFLTAGRSLTLPAFVATLVSTWYGGVLGIGEAVSYYGLGTWLLLGVPYYVFALIYAYAFAEKVRGAEQISIPERLESRYGRTAGLIGAILVFLLAVPAVHVLMLGTMVELVSGWQIAPSVLIGAIIGTLFLYKGGLLADVRVGLLAFAMMYVGFAIIAVFCLTHFDPRATLGNITDPNLHKVDGGKGPLVVLSFFILGAWTMVDPGFHQRVASAGAPSRGRIGVLISVGFWVLFDVMSITAGMYALGMLNPLPKETLQIFPLFADQVLPPGLKAAFLCGLMGTILSAMVGYTLVSGASLGREIVGRLKRGLRDDQVGKWTKLGLFIACGVAVAIALIIPSVVQLWYDWGGVLVGALLLPVSMAYGLFGGSRVNSAWVAASMVAAFLGSFAWLIYGKRTANEFLEVSVMGQTFSLGTLMPALAISAFAIGLGEVFGRMKCNG